MLDTLGFLRLVVPQQGFKFISLDRGNKSWSDRCVGTTHEQMVSFIEKHKDAPVNIYHANGGFAADGKRRANNTQFFRSLWLDIDVQKSNSPSYESVQDAVVALKEFIKRAELPKPSMIVQSGMGIHVYWCFDQDVGAVQWQILADALKAKVIAFNLMADLKVISDGARVLRPIGTTWRDLKGDKGDKPVRLAWMNPEPTYQVSQLGSRLLAASTVPVPAASVEAARAASMVDMNDDLGSSDSSDYEGCDPLRIADRCGQMARFRESGAVPYDTWWNLLGVLSRCGEEGRQYAHEWSANGYDRYDPAEVDAKLDSWSMQGGTRCSTFRETDPKGPCSTCPHTCNSPMALGYAEPPAPVAYVPETESEDVEEAEFTPIGFPERARVSKSGRLEYLVTPSPTAKDPNPEPVWVRIANVPFYLESIAVRPDGSQESDVVFFPRDGELRRFIMDHSIAQSLRDIRKVFNSQGIFVDVHVEKYIMSYIDTLKKIVKDTPTRAQMGWVPGKDEFVLGDCMITPTEIRPIRVNNNLKPKARVFDDSNDPQQWISAVRQLYSMPGGEPYQFAISAAFASVLIPILRAEEFNGIPVALTSDESGYGKSTVCKIALAAFGRVERNLNVLTGDEVSSGAVEVQCSTFNCVPHLFDEMTNKSGQETSHILYMLSNGVARARLRQDGTPRPASPPWQGVSFITGNKNIFLKLTESRVNPEAAQMRVFEIPLENYGKVESLLHASDFIETTNSIRSGYGAIGVEFIRFVMANRHKIHNTMWKTVNMISKTPGVRHDKERFYIYQIAAVCTAVGIMNKLGFVDFNVGKIYQWSMKHLASMRGNANEYQRSTEEDFALMLSTLVGQGKVIATAFGSDRSDNDLLIRGTPAVRIDRATQEVHITQRGFHDYCRDASKNPSKFRQELIDAECMVDGKLVDYALGAGVKGMFLGTSKCYKLNFARAVGPVSVRIGEEAKVIDMQAKRASKSP